MSASDLEALNYAMAGETVPANITLLTATVDEQPEEDDD